VSLLVKPNDALSITPRVVYQNLTTNGFPRVDLYNMLANPFTTVAPASLGDRQQYIQQREGLLDQFLLSDVKVDYGFGPATLTSVTSFTHRDVRVLRDATQLTGSVTYDPIGITDQASVRISSPLYDRTKLNIASEELRLACRQPTAPRGQQGVQALRQRVGPAPQPQGVDRRVDPLVRDGRIEQCQIVANRGMEELHLLRHHTDPPAQRGEPHAAEIDAPE